MSRLSLQVEGRSDGTQARATRFKTLHGEVTTPVFMPVGTQATVKSQNVNDLKTVGSQVLLANTYHLMLRPGAEVFKKMGGIHPFMNWNGPVLTDSGGFQIFSLPHSRSMKEEGAHFQSYVDGSLRLLSPESSIQMQMAINSDIMMVLDQCIPSTSTHAVARQALDLTHRWALRSLKARGSSLQSMFAIVQGACFLDLRKESIDFLTQHPFDGFAIGGLAVGETKAEREDFTALVAAELPEDRPRYLMGVGTPIDILEAIHRGVDLFDCILPNALAQRGVAFTSLGKLQLRRAFYKFSEDRLDPNCDCSTCAVYPRAYLHHLIKCDEVLGWSLVSTHNLRFYHQLTHSIRQAILENRFLPLYHDLRQKLVLSDGEGPTTPKIAGTNKKEKWMTFGEYEILHQESGASQVRHVSTADTVQLIRDFDVVLQALDATVQSDHSRQRVIWFAGMGAAWNSISFIQFLEKSIESKSGRKLKIVSVEPNLEVLQLTLKHPGRFPEIRHGAPHAVLANGRWESQDQVVDWMHIHGDLNGAVSQPTLPDVLVLDSMHLNPTQESFWTKNYSRSTPTNMGRIQIWSKN